MYGASRAMSPRRSRTARGSLSARLNKPNAEVHRRSFTGWIRVREMPKPIWTISQGKCFMRRSMATVGRHWRWTTTATMCRSTNLASHFEVAEACSHLIRSSPYRSCLGASGEGAYSCSTRLGGARSKRNCDFCRICSPGWSGGLQRLSAAPAAATSGSGRARALCARTARRRRAVADCSGNAGGRVAASGGGGISPLDRRTGPHPGSAAGGSPQVARTDAADESHRCGFATLAGGFE